MKIIIVILLVVLLLAAVVVGFLYLCPGVGKTPSKADKAYYATKTDRFMDGVFTNADEIALHMGEQSKRSDRTKPTDEIPVVESTSISAGLEGELNVYWLGHSSSLVQLGTKNILIDPVLTDYSSPVGFAGVKRFSKVAIEPDNLPQIDVCLISHDHYDHLDYQTIKEIDDKVGAYLVPLGVECILKGWGVDENKITALSWWDETTISDITVTATPGQHFSGRNPIESSTCWWCGFCFTDNVHTVYYTGDGGYADHFKEVGMRFDIDLALMECGQYDPAWASHHMFPEETGKAFEDVKADWMIPVHFGAFCICNHAWDDSIIRISKYTEENNLNIATPKIGEKVSFDKIGEFTEKWWEKIK